ncbi:hypothetical protein CTI12_AA159480 [Artemisia annua]|uniref:Uncharacterized protein n=1 Tax=Artemisia annua TaxID=35608 RepID=A0A2U1NLY6_ARTAN|nr:hypothetical protein CTI12_AA159480 [Artemisia annua]
MAERIKREKIDVSTVSNSFNDAIILESLTCTYIKEKPKKKFQQRQDHKNYFCLDVPPLEEVTPKTSDSS